MEMKTIREREQLKKDWESQVELVKEKIRSEIEENLPKKVKKALKQNLNLLTEMSMQSKEADKVLVRKSIRVSILPLHRSLALCLSY